MGIIEQEIDREAYLAMRSYADVQAEILKSLDPNPAPAAAAAAVVLTPAESKDLTEFNEMEVSNLPSSQSDRFQWGRCVVCVDLCRTPLSTAANALASEFYRQPVQNTPLRTVASLNITATSPHDNSANGNEKLVLDDDLATSLSVKSIPASASSIAASLSVAAGGGESQHVPAAFSAGTGESAITKDVVAGAQVGTAVPRSDVDAPKIQVSTTWRFWISYACERCI